MASKGTAVNVANAKREFSDLLGRVAYGGETILITRRGRPMAKLVPVDAEESDVPGLAGRGWLEENDSFFEIVDAIVKRRSKHQPRALASGRRTGPKRTTG